MWTLLQAKEKLIAGLQAGGGDGGSAPAHEANLEQLRLEKEAVEAELVTARLQGAELREELQEAEEQHTRELEQLTHQVRGHLSSGRMLVAGFSVCIIQVHALESALTSEKTLLQSATENLQRVSAESEAAREVWERERGSLTALVKVCCQ